MSGIGGRVKHLCVCYSQQHTVVLKNLTVTHHRMPCRHTCREGISKHDGVTREMCNVWKSDRLVASVILNESVGELVAQIMDWPSVRIAQDDLIWKPPCTASLKENHSVVGFHQDSAYISSQFEPYENNSVTVWIALDDTDEETGCVQYAVGSHLWKVSDE